MQWLTGLLKMQANVISILVWMLIIAWLLHRLKKQRAAKFMFVATFFCFYLCSTGWLPHLLAGTLEEKYQPLNTATVQRTNGKVYVHLLGSGYHLAQKLPATSQLGIVAQGRLVEALRIYRQVDSSILVCSGGTGWAGKTDIVSQAAVAGNAAKLLGVSPERLLLLETPNSTIEEAKALAASVDKSAMVIVVTDALHMPRAMRFFEQQGLHPVAAPTNYRSPDGTSAGAYSWWPQLENINLINWVLHEYLGNLKAKL